MTDILNKYICLNPFYHLEIYDFGVYCCCNSWNNTKIGNLGKLNEIHKNDSVLKKIQDSVLDGSYSYCNKNNCPFLLDLIHSGRVGHLFVEKDKTDISELYNLSSNLSLKLCFDQSCNLTCPSCRTKVIMANNEEREIFNDNFIEIIQIFGKKTKSLYISGSADPFASKTFRDFLINFEEDDFPILENIYIHTNGQLLNEQMWKKISKVHKYIKYIEVSIDAATEETYSKVRRGGSWNKLLKNLEFIISIPTIIKFSFSFVVQDTNYKEMEYFVELITKMIGTKDYTIYFNKILNWGTYSDKEFIDKQIFKEFHPEFNNFLIELNKIVNTHNTHIDMPDIISKYSLKGIKRII